MQTSRSSSSRSRKVSFTQQPPDADAGTPEITQPDKDISLTTMPDSSPTTSDDFPAPSDGYSSADEGPRNKKARQLQTKSARTTSTSTTPSPSHSQDEQVHEILPAQAALAAAASSESDSDLSGSSTPDTDFSFDEQLFKNMFASSETLSHDYSPGSPRPIVIDGSNIAFSHGNNTHFSEQGILICIDYFQQRGHDVKVFVSRCQHGHFTRKIAKDLEARQILVFTPSRLVNGRRITAYDDRFILQYATVKKAIVVSNDNYRDLYDENEKYHEVIRERLLQFTWPEENVLMFPNDPLGRNGPRLDAFLKFPGGGGEAKASTSAKARASAQAREESDEDEDHEEKAGTSSGYESSSSTDEGGWMTDANGEGEETDSDGDL